MKKILILFFSFFIIGCGTNVFIDTYSVQNLKISHKNPKVLILPFEQYSNRNDNLWWSTNILIYNAIADKFIIHNIFPVPFQDIANLFIKNEETKNKEISPSLLEELNNPMWSQVMKQEILSIINEDMRRKNFSILKNYHISDEEIYKLCNKFHVDYFVKGEITELSFTNDDSFNPFKVGLINSPIKLISRLFFGNPQSHNWGVGQEILTTSTIGAVIGYNVTSPYGPGSKKLIINGHPLYGERYFKKTGGDADYDFKNAFFWGATAGLVTYFASHGGFNPKIVLGLRVYIYDAKSRRLIWTNRVHLYATPDVFYCNQNFYELLITAINAGIDEIFDNFWKNNNLIIAGKGAK